MAPRETENNAYAKFWGDKQRALWYVMVFSGVANKVVVVCQKAKTHAYLDTFILRDRSFIRGGLGWCKWGAVIPFCAPENRGAA